MRKGRWDLIDGEKFLEQMALLTGKALEAPADPSVSGSIISTCADSTERPLCQFAAMAARDGRPACSPVRAQIDQASLLARPRYRSHSVCSRRVAILVAESL